MEEVNKALSPSGRDNALANGIHIGDERFVVTDIGTDDPKNLYIKMRKVWKASRTCTPRSEVRTNALDADMQTVGQGGRFRDQD